MLSSFVPKSLIPGVAVVETIIELGLGIALLLGIYQRVVAWSSASSLLSFALTMSIALGNRRAFELFCVLGARRGFASGRGRGAACRSAGEHSTAEAVSSKCAAVPFPE